MGAFPPGSSYDFAPPTVSASQAMGALTASAIVVGTSALSNYHNVQQIHGAPFVIHPSHAYAPEHEEEQSRKLMQMQEDERKAGSRSPEGASEKEPEIKQEVKKEADAQDYFSSLLGSTKWVSRLPIMLLEQPANLLRFAGTRRASPFAVRCPPHPSCCLSLTSPQCLPHVDSSRTILTPHALFFTLHREPLDWLVCSASTRIAA